ncbi:UNVERIFIED_CONTAM: DNA-directed RNA polymerase II subunit RPB1 [Sesamum radiatum]|uniref:DNA-directed RNA polymerase subunit n=1 Tax=Sesamum radiatum TaxID=300843 RepID=A0AAW2SK59_SESRA
MDLRFPFSPAEVAKVRVVQFGIISPDEIRQMSVVHIEHGETMERGKPKIGGLSDPRLGTIDRKMKCETCMSNMAECPGHFGHLELAKPMFHIGFMKVVLSILRSVCFNCSKILADEVSQNHMRKLYLLSYSGTLWRRHGSHVKSRVDVGAQQQPKISIDGMKMVAEYKIQKKKNDDQDQLPEPVERKQLLSAEKDDLTHQLAMIIRHNENLKLQERNGAPAHIISELPKDLGPIKSICSRLKAKEGRIREHYLENRLKELVEHGPHPPPGKTGAKYIIRDDGQRLDLRYLKKSSDQHLELGYKVERHLNDGDFVLFNRQPSLHKMSIMGHRIKIMPYSTFRLNLSVTSPYNADFDGDEMNMHVPQSFETRAEVMELMLDVFMNILMWWEDFDGKVPAPTILKPRPLWTGKQVFNLIIPKQINLLRYSAWHQETEKGYITPGDTQVRIEKGDLLSGTLCKKALGTSTGSLIHVIWEEVGPDAARKFLGHTQWLVNYWLLQNAFSMGIGDTIADAATMEKINETISNAKNQVKELIRAAQEKQLEAEPGRTMMESFENRVNQVLNKARDDAGSSAQKSLSEKSRGFVENSYLRGLTPQEFFFHAMGGREGLIDTAVKTSETGYIQRRLVKAMEDIMVKYDGTVRNSLGDVIQFLYGEDGMDAVWIESQPLESLKLKKSDFNDMYKYEIDSTNWNPSYMLPEAVEDLKTIREIRSVFDAEVQKLEADRYQLGTEIATTGDNSWPLPVNIKRLVLNAQKTFKVDFRRPSDMHPMEIVEAVDKLQERLKVVVGDDYLSMEAQKNATLFFNIFAPQCLSK